MHAGNQISKAVAAPVSIALSIALLITLSITAPAAPEGGPSDLGRTVSAVELRLDAPVGRRTDLRSLVAIRVGAPLTEQKVRRTISNLQATGLFSEVEVLSRRDPPAPGGARPKSASRSSPANASRPVAEWSSPSGSPAVRVR